MSSAEQYRWLGMVERRRPDLEHAAAAIVCGSAGSPSDVRFWIRTADALDDGLGEFPCPHDAYVEFDRQFRELVELGWAEKIADGTYRLRRPNGRVAR